MAPPFHCVVSPWTLWFTVAVLGVWSVSFDFGWHPLLLFRRRDHGVDHRIRVRNLTGVLRRHLLLMLINELLIINNCHLAFEEYRNVTPTYLHTLIIVNRLNRLLSNTRDPNFRSFQIQIYIKKKRGSLCLNSKQSYYYVHQRLGGVLGLYFHDFSSVFCTHLEFTRMQEIKENTLRSR